MTDKPRLPVFKILFRIGSIFLFGSVALFVAFIFTGIMYGNKAQSFGMNMLQYIFIAGFVGLAFVASSFLGKLFTKR